MEIKDYADGQYVEIEWSVMWEDIKKQFGLCDANVIAIKVDNYIKYNEVDSIEYYITTADDLYEVLDDIIFARDFKNGCQLYTDHFQITGGACFDDKTDEQIGFRITKVYFKEVVWK